MPASIRTRVKVLLHGVAWLLFATAGIAFFVGGRTMSEFAKTDRPLAEMEGLALAAVCAGLGAVAKAAAEHLDEEEGNGASPSADESLR
jgi:hypothetical protein